MSDPVQATLSRIDAATRRKTESFLVPAAEEASRPDQALANFERWLLATGSPETLYDSVVSVPELGRLLIALLGASHQIADVLVQNPELANIVLDPHSLQTRPDPALLDREIAAMLDASGSYSHSLDRLRLAKQIWHLRIAAADLGQVWAEEEVWRALSDVADAVLRACLPVVWADVCRQRGHQGPCPVSIIAFGKLGGQELNFSSDVDLVYLLINDADEATEKVAVRFCEAFNRALSDRMGRGSLYRVDLRLRPYGAAGQLAPKTALVEGYYANYAETWEHLALLRSRVVVGDDKLKKVWDAMRDRTCFQPQRGEWVVDELLRMRTRIEETHTPDDIKRGEGGIRDIEFLTQILQLLHANKNESLKTRSTCDALRELAKANVLPQEASDELIASYTFLRQVEHRIQLLGDQQTHTIPLDDQARLDLARRSGFVTLAPFESALEMHRSRARGWYRSVLSTPEKNEARKEVARKVGRSAAIVQQWIDDLPASESFYESLLENESSLARIVAVADRAPALVPSLRRSLAVTEQVMSGEIAEESKKHSDLRTEWLKCAVKYVLLPGFDFSSSIAKAMDDELEKTSDCPFKIVALGSYGGRELTLFSDLDVLFYDPSGQDHEQVEKCAQKLLAAIQGLRRNGAPIELDLRLRPEGKKGRLVQTEESFKTYARTKMEPWERLALGRARPLQNDLPDPIKRAAFDTPLNLETIKDLARMKKRVETERVPVQFRRRHIKLGPGGQDDVLWLVQLLWWRHAKEVDMAKTTVNERLDELARIQALNAVEKDQLAQAWRFLHGLCLNLALLGFNDDVLPENPDKLLRIGEATKLGGPNDVLQAYARHSQTVRGLFEACLERLGG